MPFLSKKNCPMKNGQKNISMLQSDASKTTDDVGTSVKEVVVMKIGWKRFELKVKLQLTIKIDLKKIDWNFWLSVGTFLATLYGALK